MEIDPFDHGFVFAFGDENAWVVVSSINSFQSLRKASEKIAEILFVVGSDNFFEDFFEKFFVRDQKSSFFISRSCKST